MGIRLGCCPTGSGGSLGRWAGGTCYEQGELRKCYLLNVKYLPEALFTSFMVLVWHGGGVFFL